MEKHTKVLNKIANNMLEYFKLKGLWTLFERDLIEIVAPVSQGAHRPIVVKFF